MQPVISLVLPYWDRQAAADRALASLAAQYAGLSLEVIVVDDGTPEPFRPPEGLALDLRVLRLPRKDGPLSSCVPMNRGVMIARGAVIALSSIEMIHTRPVLADMAAAVYAGGMDRTYVLAACWAPDSRTWHCHSQQRRGDDGDVGSWLPPGADYHFLAMLSRQLWEKAGGFDEDYRQGAGYEDADFVRRLQRAGAAFQIRDDLVIEHPRQDARAKWTPAMFQRNRALFLSTWDRLR
jgi:hypothetical protein